MKPLISRLRHALTGIAWVVLVSAIGVSAVAAQSTETYTLSDERYEVNFPASWEVTEENDGALTAFGPDFAVFVYPPEYLQEYIEYDKNSTPVDVLVDMFPIWFDGRARASDVSDIEVGDRVGAKYEIEQESDGTTFEYWLIVLPMSDDEFGVVMFGALPNILAFRPRAIDPILLSFDVAESVLAAEASASGGSASGGGEPCFVIVDSAQTARLRVGPGENRTSVAFLPPNDDFSVTGRFEGDDGSVWYQLDKAEAAPQSAANEIWVSADEVETVGDCDTVGEMAAPPVVPIVGGGSPPTDPGAPPPADQPVTGAIPLGGTWRFILDPVANASCQGGGNVVLNTADLYSGNTVNQLSVIGDGSSVRYGSDVWTRTPGSNEYVGNLQFAANSAVPNGRVYLRVVNPSLMQGTLVSNFTIDGTPCSDTVNVSVRRG